MPQRAMHVEEIQFHKKINRKINLHFTHNGNCVHINKRLYVINLFS